MRGIVCLAAVFAALLESQGQSPLLRIDFGVSHSSILATLGKPFQMGKFGSDDHSAQVGVPPGRWEIFHVPASGDRMYAVMLHFTTPKYNDLPTVSSPVDSLMLEPIGQITALQVLNDNPALGRLCKGQCDVVRLVDAEGRVSILVKPVHADANARVIYFETSGAATRRLESMPLQSRIEWVYAVRSGDFDSRHPKDRREIIESWQPEKHD